MRNRSTTSEYTASRGSLRASVKGKFIEEMLDPCIVGMVRQVVLDFRRLVDDSLHYATGFVLEDAGRKLRIDIEVDSELPVCVEQFVGNNVPGDFQIKDGRFRVVDMQAELFAGLRDHISKPAARRQERDWQDIADWLRNTHFENMLAEFSSDVLGEYDSRHQPRPRIHLHALVIGLVSQALELSVNHVSLITLIHEYAHAYTHLGKDVDDNAWSLEGYENLDVTVKEAVAQFYTAYLCNELDKVNPGLKVAFDRLTSMQNSMYRQYQLWPCQGRHIGECVRIGIIKARKERISSESEFEACLNDAVRLIGR